MKLYDDGLLENGRWAGARLMRGLEALRDHPLADMAAKTPLPAAAMPAARIIDRARDNGLIIRAFAQGVLGFAPPLCCTDADIDAMLEQIRLTLDQTSQNPDVRHAMA